MNETTTETWFGYSMKEIYQDTGPWNYTVQPVTPEKYHNVLYQLPPSLESPPKPHRNLHQKHWDNDHVKMPYSPNNLFPVTNENGETETKSRWELIQTALLQPINSSGELELLINSYNRNLPSLEALKYFLDEVLEEEESDYFFKFLLPGIIRLALQLPEILPGNLPFLKYHHCKSISLSQLQIASLLANGFLSTFPWKKESNCRGINFISLFSAHFRSIRRECVAEKLKTICHYFKRVLTKAPVGVVTFERKFLHESELPSWSKMAHLIGETKLHVSSIGTIEDDGLGLLQVDFANKNIGGGVLQFGCVQEEIRFIICPELIVSRLFTEQLGSHEALVITGIERYSDYSGYGENYVWTGDYIDKTPYDSSGRRRTSVVAIDATHFVRTKDQYTSAAILRELNKAYVGFHSRLDCLLPAVATGNWGCGAFNGNPELKSLIQFMACRAARRNIVYFTFGNEELSQQIFKMYKFIVDNHISIAQLWGYLCRFCDSNQRPENLLPYIQQLHLDSKSQPSIRSFFGIDNKKSPQELPSTSSQRALTHIEKMDAVFDALTDNDHQEVDEIQDFDMEEVFEFSPQQEVLESKQISNREIKKHQEVIDLLDQIEGKVEVEKSGENASASLLSTVDEFNKIVNKCSFAKKNKPVNTVRQTESSKCKKRNISDYFLKE